MLNIMDFLCQLAQKNEKYYHGLTPRSSLVLVVCSWTIHLQIFYGMILSTTPYILPTIVQCGHLVLLYFYSCRLVFEPSSYNTLIKLSFLGTTMGSNHMIFFLLRLCSLASIYSFPSSGCMIMTSIYSHRELPPDHLPRVILYFFLQCLSTTVVRFQGREMGLSDLLCVQNPSLHYFEHILPKKPKPYYIYIIVPSYL